MSAYKSEIALLALLREHANTAELVLFFVKDSAGHHAYCNVCLALLLLTGRVFSEMPEDEGGPVLLSGVTQLRFAKPGDAMKACDYCDEPAEVRHG